MNLNRDHTTCAAGHVTNWGKPMSDVGRLDATCSRWIDEDRTECGLPRLFIDGTPMPIRDALATTGRAWLPWESNGDDAWYRETENGGEYVVYLDPCLEPGRFWRITVNYEVGPDAPPLGVHYLDAPVSSAEARQHADAFAARTIRPDGTVSER